MAYKLTKDDLASVSDLELAFSTERLLPCWEDIPEDLKKDNPYSQLAEAIFDGRALPALEMEFLEGFEGDGVPQSLNKCVRAHLQSFGPKHQHKIAGVGFMMAQVFRLGSAGG